jgi:uncharacterized protein YgbK (DUF1537 family)
MTRLVVLADDLTGALDASAPFAMHGLSTAVALAPAGLTEALASGAEIVGVSTNSREIDPSAATAAVQAALAELPRGLPIFKKVDSRLKGNIPAELDAITYTSALVIPAIPAFGRWVRDGQLGGFGLAEPISVASRLGAHAGKATIPDAATQADIAAALAKRGHDLLVGARGLAEALAQSWSTANEPHLAAAAPTSTICVIGSTDPITLAQIEALRAHRPDLVYLAAPLGVAPAQLPAAAPLTPGIESAQPARVAANLAASLARLAPAPGTRLVLSGGATAHAILEAMGIGVLFLDGEALPGLPRARGGGFTIITKSGGFGDSDTLLRLLASPVAGQGE